MSTPVVLGRRLNPGRLAPAAGPLVDTWGRVHTDLRLSVTDRCNLRCTYGMPEEGVEWLPRADLLKRGRDRAGHHGGLAVGGSLAAPHRRGAAAASRADRHRRPVAAVGFDDLAMTTNAMSLARTAEPLANAGLRRVNVSCDSLDPARFAQIRRHGDLATVLAAMDAAERVGLIPVKVNVVVTCGVNDDEVVAFARFAPQTGQVVRFIEYMPLDAQHAWERHQVVAGAEIVRRISQVWPLEPVGGRADDPAPLLRAAVWAKLPGHGVNDPGFVQPARPMSRIGG